MGTILSRGSSLLSIIGYSQPCLPYSWPHIVQTCLTPCPPPIRIRSASVPTPSGPHTIHTSSPPAPTPHPALSPPGVHTCSAPAPTPHPYLLSALSSRGSVTPGSLSSSSAPAQLPASFPAASRAPSSSCAPALPRSSRMECSACVPGGGHGQGGLVRHGHVHGARLDTITCSAGAVRYHGFVATVHGEASTWKKLHKAQRPSKRHKA